MKGLFCIFIITRFLKLLFLVLELDNKGSYDALSFKWLPLKTRGDVYHTVLVLLILHIYIAWAENDGDPQVIIVIYSKHGAELMAEELSSSKDH